MAYKLDWNGEEVINKMEAAFKKTAMLYVSLFTQELGSPQFEWPVGDSPRDAVDTGQLRRSIKTNIEAKGVEFTWDVDYSAHVYYGYKTSRGTVMPARPWAQLALEKKPFEAVFSRILQI